jgi:undecaprenyl-diphosphatase
MWSTIGAFDTALMGWLRAFHAPWLDNVMTWFSAGGGAGLVWLTLGLLAMGRRKDRAAGWRVMLAVMLSYALVDGLIKPAIARPRPATDETPVRPYSALVDAGLPKRALPAMPESYTFPSGHATASFASAITVSRMWPRTSALWWALAIMIGYSRIYLGHHYPLDIAGGALLGISVAWWVLGGRAAFATVRRNPQASPPAALASRDRT